MIETEFNFVRGTTYSRNINLTDYGANIDEMYFTVKESETDRIPVIKKSLNNGIFPIIPDTVVEEEPTEEEPQEEQDEEQEEQEEQEESEDESEESNVKSFNLIIEADDTETLKLNKPYPFDIKVITYTDGNPVKKVIVKGTITLSANITWKTNES